MFADLEERDEGENMIVFATVGGGENSKSTNKMPGLERIHTVRKMSRWLLWDVVMSEDLVQTT